LVDAFNKSQSSVKVVMDIVPFAGFNAAVQADLGSRDATPDVFIVDQPTTAAWAARGYLVDLTKSFPSYVAAAKGSLYPAAVSGSEVDGQLYGGPIWESTQDLFYNAALLKKAGIALPSINPALRWTWQQTETAAKTVMAKTGVSCGILFEQPTEYYQLQPMIMSDGGGTGLTGSGNLTPDLETPAWNTVLTWYQGLFKAKISPNLPSAEIDPEFADGKCAFLAGEDVLGSAIQAKLDFGVAPLPYFAGGKAVTPNEADSIGINPFSKNQSAALKFLEFATVNAEGNELSRQVTTLPPANETAGATAFNNLSTYPLLAGYPKLIKYDLAHTAVPRPTSIGYPQFQTQMESMLTDIIGGTSVSSALAYATTQLKAAFSQLH